MKLKTIFDDKIMYGLNIKKITHLSLTRNLIFPTGHLLHNTQDTLNRYL